MHPVSNERQLLVLRYHLEDLWCSIAYFRKWVKIYQSTCRGTPLPPQNETASMVPNLKPPSLPKMKLPIGCPIWNPLKHEYYRFLSIHVYSNLPKIGRQCTPSEEWKSWIQVKVTFWFWLMYPPPNWNWTKHECYRKKIISREVIKYILPIYPPPSIIIIWFYAWTGNWWISISNGYMDSNPIHQPSPAKKIKCSFWITFNFWWLAGLVDGLEPHPPPLSSQKHKMLIFGLCSTSDDQRGLLMDSNPIHQPSLAKKLKCSFLDYVQLLMTGQVSRWTWTPSTTPLQPKNKMLIFGLRSTSDDWLGWSMDSNPICHPSPANKIKCLFLDYIQLLVIGRAGQWTWTPSTSPLQPKK